MRLVDFAARVAVAICVSMAVVVWNVGCNRPTETPIPDPVELPRTPPERQGGVSNVSANPAAAPAGTYVTEYVDPSDGALAVHVEGGSVVVVGPLPDPTPTAPVITTALTACKVVKAAVGTHVSSSVQVDATAPNGTYYVQLIQGSAACPADGAVTFLHAPVTVVHSNGVPDLVAFNDAAAPATFSTGLSIALSSTQFTKTSAGNTFLITDSSVR